MAEKKKDVTESTEIGVVEKKCYIYTRVSTAIQVDGYSLDAQKDKLQNMLNIKI